MQQYCINKITAYICNYIANILYKNKLKPFTAILFLLLFILSNWHTYLHNHEGERIPNSQANLCQKAIFYPNNDASNKCTHLAHIYTTEVNCDKCHQIKVIYFIYQFENKKQFNSIVTKEFQQPMLNIPIRINNIFSNKGPPAFFQFS